MPLVSPKSGSTRFGAFSACLLTAAATCGFGGEKKVRLTKSKFINERPDALARKSKQEIATLRKEAVGNFKKLAEFEVKASFDRQKLTKKNIKVLEAQSLKSKSASVVKIFQKEKKIIEQKIETLKNAFVLKKLGDRMIVFFSLGMVQSRVSKITMLENKLEAVKGYLIEPQQKLDDATNNINGMKKKFALDGTKFGESVDRMADLETVIIAKLAAGFEGEINNLGGKDCKIKAEWDAAWEKSLGGKGNKVTEQGKAQLQSIRDNRWDVLCKRVREKSKLDKQSALRSELTGTSFKGEELKQKLQSVDELRVTRQKSCKSAGEVVAAKKKELETFENAIRLITKQIEAKKSARGVVKDNITQKITDDERVKLEKSLGVAEKGKEKASANLQVAERKLKDVNEKFDVAVGDVDRMKQLIAENGKKESKLKQEIGQIDIDLDKTRVEIDAKRSAIARDQMDYLKSKLPASPHKDSLTTIGWSQSLLGSH